jgi:hypothetical protein
MVDQISFCSCTMIKKIVLLPMSPEAIVRDDIARAAKAKSENNKIAKSVANKHDEV